MLDVHLSHRHRLHCPYRYHVHSVTVGSVLPHGAKMAVEGKFVKTFRV